METDLRDQFAMAALTGIIANNIVEPPAGHGYYTPPNNVKYRTELAYKYADAMMEAKDKAT